MLFVRMPLEWIRRIRTVHRSSQVWTVALVIRHWYAVTRSPSFWLSTTAFFPPLELSRYAVRRALVRLEQLGLIHVRRRRGKMPVVTVLDEAPSRSPTALCSTERGEG